MGRVIAQVNYSTDYAQERPREEKRAMAESRATIPGFIWKVWLRNEEEGRGGGIFLFEDRASAEAWLAARADRKFHPATKDITVELFDVDEELTRISKGPIDLVPEGIN